MENKNFNVNKYISTKDELAKRFKYIRNVYGLSQQKIANYLNVERSTYAYYETQKTIPDIFTIIKLSYFYKIDINYFILKKNKNYKQYLKQFIV